MATAPLTWARLPFATRPLLTTADMAAQRDTVRVISPMIRDRLLLLTINVFHLCQFLEIWNEDGVTAEPEDDFA
jgi:cohesin loading factor subunit SCC2